MILSEDFQTLPCDQLYSASHIINTSFDDNANILFLGPSSVSTVKWKIGFGLCLASSCHFALKFRANVKADLLIEGRVVEEFENLNV